MLGSDSPFAADSCLSRDNQTEAQYVCLEHIPKVLDRLLGVNDFESKSRVGLF